MNACETGDGVEACGMGGAYTLCAGRFDMRAMHAVSCTHSLEVAITAV